jgi:hypothetical protein
VFPDTLPTKATFINAATRPFNEVSRIGVLGYEIFITAASQEGLSNKELSYPRNRPWRPIGL